MVFQKGYEPEPNVSKIAVVRVNALGDFIFALPALEALQQTYPQAEIVLLGKQWHKDFLKGRPGPVSRVEVVPLYRGVGITDERFLATADQQTQQELFFERMRKEKFDLALQLHGGGRNSNPFVRRLEARLSVGLHTADAEPLDRNAFYYYYQHEILRLLEVVSLVGAQTSRIEPQLTVTASDLAEAVQIVPFTAKPLVAIHPGATALRRCWPVEKFAQVCEALLEYDTQLVITGTPPERALVDALLSNLKPQYQEQVQDVCGKLSLNGLAGLLSRCQLVISNDSGPLHLAIAVGAATVGIYWCGNVINAAPFTRTRHRPAISWRLNCPICGIDCTQASCDHQVSFVGDVTTQEVTHSAFELLYS